MKLAAARGLLPTALSSAELRDAVSAEVRRASVFSARTTSLPYLALLKQVVEEVVAGKMQPAEARVKLRAALDALGYDAEAGGFPDQRTKPANAGGLQDLRSARRLTLILETQQALWRSAGQQLRGMTPGAVYQFPAWELRRVGVRKKERIDWPARWARVGGRSFGGRMIARKGDPVWAALGSSAHFRDALDTETPPFAFGSGMGWVAVPRAECLRLGVISEEEGRPAEADPDAVTGALPTLVEARRPPGVSEELAARVRAAMARRGGATAPA